HGALRARRWQPKPFRAKARLLLRHLGFIQPEIPRKSFLTRHESLVHKRKVQAEKALRPSASAWSRCSSRSWPQKGSPLSTKVGTPTTSREIASAELRSRVAAISGLLAALRM